MKSVEVWEGPGNTGTRSGPIVDLELPENANVTALALTVRVQNGNATAALECRTWDDPTWKTLQSAYVPQHSEQTVRAEVDRDRELHRWTVTTYGRGSFWANYSVIEES